MKKVLASAVIAASAAIPAWAIAVEIAREDGWAARAVALGAAVAVFVWIRGKL